MSLLRDPKRLKERSPGPGAGGAEVGGGSFAAERLGGGGRRRFSLRAHGAGWGGDGVVEPGVGICYTNGHSPWRAFPQSAGMPSSGEDLESGLDVLSKLFRSLNWEGWGGLGCRAQTSCLRAEASANCWDSQKRPSLPSAPRVVVVT